MRVWAEVEELALIEDDMRTLRRCGEDTAPEYRDMGRKAARLRKNVTAVCGVCEYNAVHTMMGVPAMVTLLNHAGHVPACHVCAELDGRSK